MRQAVDAAKGWASVQKELRKLKSSRNRLTEISYSSLKANTKFCTWEGITTGNTADRCWKYTHCVLNPPRCPGGSFLDLTPVSHHPVF